MDPVSVNLLVLVMTSDGRSRNFVDPRLLNLHLSPKLPEPGSDELQKEVQQVVAAVEHARMNVEVLAPATSIFRLSRRDLSVQLMVMVLLMVMRAS